MSTLGNWSARHGHALVSTLGHLGRHRLATALTVLALSLALALPLALGVLVDNLRGISVPLTDSLGLSVYLRPQLPDAAVRQAQASARRLPGVANVTLISAAQGLAMLRQQSGLGAALDSLTDNPLPDVLQVRPGADATSPTQLEQLRAALARLPQVDSVQLDRDWATRFHALLGLARQLLRLSGALLAAGVVAVVGNTVRLEIQGRREEIEVTKLVGGSNGFVRRPFLYAGVCYGSLAAAVAWAIVRLARLALAGPVQQLAATYGSDFVLRGPDLRELGVLLAAGALLGWLGAAIAAGRHLARIEPRAH
jgi:cell division transport system permease protein